MPNRRQLNRLGKGVHGWNDWRSQNPDVRIDLIRANLIGANLRGANLSGAQLIEADLTLAQLIEADLTLAMLTGANLSEANLSLAMLSGAILSGAILSGADLSGTNLSLAMLTGARLAGANLGGANLKGANLSGANLRGANLSGANLRGATLPVSFSRDEVVWDGNTIWPDDMAEDQTDDFEAQRADITDDETREQLLNGAIEDYLSEFRHLLHDSAPALDDYTAAKVQYAIDALVLENRNPDGADPLQVERAQAIGLKALIDADIIDNPIADQAAQLGHEDPKQDGKQLTELLETAAANNPQPASPAPNDSQNNDAGEDTPTLPERTKDALWDGYDDLIKSLPKAAATTAAAAMAWAANQTGLLQTIIKMVLAIWEVLGP